jgi:hypothetical protein
MRTILDGFKQTCLDKGKLKGTEFARKQFNDLQGRGRRQNKVVYTVNDTVGGKL